MELKKEFVQWLAGMAVSAVLVYMSWLSMRSGFTLQAPVIVGMLTLVVLLMYGVDSITTLIDSWKGGDETNVNVDARNQHDPGGGEDE